MVKMLLDESGASLVEYAVIVALIAIVCIVAVLPVGRNASAALSTAAVSI